MITGFDKAIVALLGALVTIASSFGYNLTFLTPDIQVAISAILTAAAVYLVPNKQV